MGVLRVNKFSLVLLVLSSLVFALSLYLKPNQIVGKKDVSMPKIEVPELPKISERKEFSGYSLKSPLGEKELLAVPKKTVEIPSEVSPPKVNMLYKGREAYVLFGEEIRKEGESLGEFVVVRIGEERVLLRKKKGGKEIWVNLDGF